MSEAETRKKGAKKRNLHQVNEHFEPLFDAVSASAIVLQQPAKFHVLTAPIHFTFYEWSIL
jgi:hypothetical protein